MSLLFFLSWSSVLYFVPCASVYLPALFLRLWDLWHSCCSASTEASDTKADMWWEMDRKWERLEALLELRRRYFHTSSSRALSTRPPDSSDWTGSITVSGWNRLRCCFYYIRLLHSPSSLLPPPRCPAPSLRPLLVIYLLWAFLIWARVAHHCSQRVCLREWKLLFYSLRIYGLLTRCLHERAASRGQKLLRAASSSLNLVQMNRILFRNMFQNIQNFLSAALVSWHDH